MAFFGKGVFLEQHKEPMLSGDILEVKQGIKTFESNIEFESVEEITPEEIIQLCEAAEIRDENDGVLLSEKLKKASEGMTLIIDAIDDEPYVCSQMALTIHKRDEICLGARLIAKAIHAMDIHIAVYAHISGIRTYIPNLLGGIEVREIAGKYPAESRIYSKIMKKKNNLVVGAASAVHMARAALEKRKMTTTFVTVAGDAVVNPKNVEVPIGTTANDLLKLCGLAESPEVIVIGGSMTGKSTFDPDNEVITERNSAVLAFLKSHRTEGFHCIGCGRCAHACPEELEPERIMQYFEHGNISRLKIYDPDHCNGCGACSYVCPARIDIAAQMLKAKAAYEAYKGEKKHE